MNPAVNGRISKRIRSAKSRIEHFVFFAYCEFQPEILLDLHEVTQPVLAYLVDDPEPAVSQHFCDGLVAEYAPLRESVLATTPFV